MSSRAKGYVIPEAGSEEFRWEDHLRDTGGTPAPPEYFHQSFDPPENLFAKDMKLETTDPRCNTNRCLATVVQTLGPRLRLRLDGADACNDFWVMVDSHEIHPVGFTKSRGGFLLPPIGYQGDTAKWGKYLKEKLDSCNAAPENCFKKGVGNRPMSNKFQAGMKLEAVDRKNPYLISPATVMEVRNDDIKITFDGWANHFDIWCRYDSRDIFPVGWCAKAGHPIQPPPRKPMVTSRSSTPRLDRSSCSSPASFSGEAPLAVIDEPVASVEESEWSKGNESLTVVTPNEEEQHRISPAVATSQNASVSPKGSKTATSTAAISPKSSKAAHPITSKPSKADAPKTDKKSTAKKAIHPNLERKNVAKKSPTSLNRTDPTTQASRKTTPWAKDSELDPPDLSPGLGHLLGGGGTNGNRSASSQSPSSSSKAQTQKPDIVITCKIPADMSEFRVFIQSGCKCGPHLNRTKLMQLPPMLGPGSVNHLMREAIQCLINSAADSQRAFLHVMPGQGDLVVTADFDGNTNARHLPFVGNQVNTWTYLKEYLQRLQACPNLLSDSIGCPLCDDEPGAKRPRVASPPPAEQSGSIMVDLSRNKHSPEDGLTGFKPEALNWSVHEVVDFIARQDDETVSSQAENFRKHEIDGKALMLLNSEMIIRHMSIKLGPALKIGQAIERLRGLRRPNY